ncbi:MAG: hypothetical protein HYT63_01790 [Candidatus Yanofskybacteria bacterium]|nr:hypothetical protein [Candidatus Yanofskybacteria bacterium]
MSEGGLIQLLPETRRKLEIKLPGENHPVYLAVGFLVLVALLFGGLKVYSSILKNNLTTLDEEGTALEKSRDRAFESELLVLNKRFALSSGLIDGHIIWSEALVKLQNLMPKQSQMDTFFADTQARKIELKGRASSYTVIAQQIASFLSEEAVLDIDLNKVNSLSSGMLEYDMKIIFDKNKFLLFKKQL